VLPRDAAGVRAARPVGKARSRSRVIGVRVHCDGGAREVESGRARSGIVCTEAAGRDDDQLGLRAPHGLPCRRPRRLTGRSEHVDTARELDHLRKPMTGRERRLEPFGEENAPPRQAADCRGRRIDRRPHLGDDLLAAVDVTEGIREDVHGLRYLRQRARIERERRCADGAGVRELDARHRADRAQVLRHDQVRCEPLDQVCVDRVQRCSFAQ
jgi:hypothetical protein